MRAYLSRTSAPTPVLIRAANGFQIILGKVRPITSPGREPSTSSDHCSRQPPPPEWPPAGWRWLDPPDHADRNHHERHQRADHDGPPSPCAAFRHLETLGPHRLDPPG